MDKTQRRRGPLLWLAARTWRFWFTVVVLLLVLYVGSFGPACWWTAREAKGVGVVNVVYQPIMRVSQPPVLRRAIHSYATWKAQKWLIIRHTPTNECAWVFQAWSVGPGWSGH